MSDASATGGSGPVDRFRSLLRLRIIEEQIGASYGAQQMRCPTYLSIGQEAVAVGVAAAVGPGNRVFSAHRNHAHYLASGGSLRAMIAELHGKKTGCGEGRGGSLHLLDLSVGFMGSAPIVASTIPIAAGAAFADRLLDHRSLTVVFFGDGACEAGAFYETLNFAAVHSLPLLFVCENNLYAIYSPLSPRQPAGRSMAHVAAAVGVPSAASDGQDVEQVFAVSAAAVDRIRAGCGPQFLEFATYRFVQHVGPGGDEHLPYRSRDEIDSWRARDPVDIAQRRLLETGAIDAADVASWRRLIEAEVDEAFQYAQRSDWPDRAALLQHVYADSAPGW